MERVELSGDAKAFAQRRFVAVGLGRRDGERAFDAADNEAVAADRQLRQRDPALGDGASVGEVAPQALRRLDGPFGDGAVLAHNPSVGLAGEVAQRHDKRLIEAQHEREGQAAPLSVVDEPGQAFARLRLACNIEADRLKKRDLGFR